MPRPGGYAMRRNLLIALFATALGGCCWEDLHACVAYRNATGAAICTEVSVRTECFSCYEEPPPGIQPLETTSAGACAGTLSDVESCAALGFTVHCQGEYYVRPPSGC